MKKPHGRRVKKEVGQILRTCTRSRALEALARIPDEQLTGHLFSHFYHLDPLIKFRSATAMGDLALRITGYSMEKARIILRRIMWNLNDESGGIGWGSPEAMGEILAQSQELAGEFKSILFSYLETGKNQVEHEMLQQGVVWGVGTYLKAAPHDLTEPVQAQLFFHLNGPDPVKRGYAARALIHGRCFDCSHLPAPIRTDHAIVPIYTGWNFLETRISDMAHACTRPEHKTFLTA